VIFTIFFFVGMVGGIRLVAWAMNNRPKPQEDCSLHQWQRKEVDPDDPEMGSYLVCTVCRQLPGGELEQHHVSKVP